MCQPRLREALLSRRRTTHLPHLAPPVPPAPVKRPMGFPILTLAAPMFPHHGSAAVATSPSGPGLPPPFRPQLWSRPLDGTVSLEQLAELPEDQRWLHLEARQAERIMWDLAKQGTIPKIVDLSERPRHGREPLQREGRGR
jgi:hypothetical protein